MKKQFEHLGEFFDYAKKFNAINIKAIIDLNNKYYTAELPDKNNFNNKKCLIKYSANTNELKTIFENG